MEVVIKTNNVTKTYGSNTVVSNVSMNIHRGDIYGFIGSNGAGKTTFIRCLMGLIKPTSGDIEILGASDSASLAKMRRKIGAIVESPAISLNMTAYNSMYVHGLLYGLSDKAKINELLTLVGLSNTGKKKVKDFSLGMRQRLAIAQTLINDPEILILDEPTNGMDPQGIIEIREFLLQLQSKRNITILISSHILSELEKLATRIGIIEHGKLISELDTKDISKLSATTFVVRPSDIGKSRQIIEELGKLDDVTLADGLITIKGEDAFRVINKALIVGNIDIDVVSKNSATLESYFIDKVNQ